MLRIRPAEPRDAGEIVRLCAAHAAFECAGYEPANKARKLANLLFASPARLFCHVVEAGPGNPPGLVGYAAWAEEISTWEAEAYVHLDCLYLEPSARRRGLGRRLVAEVVRDAMARGCRLVQWQTPASNADAIRFYARLGAAGKPKVRFCLAGDALRRLVRRVDGSGLVRELTPRSG